MNKTKLLAGITSMALMGAGLYSSAVPSNPAFAANNDTQEGSSDTGVNLPRWVPLSRKSALEFLNTHGRTYAKDGLACVIVYGDEKPQTSEAAVVYEQGYFGPVNMPDFRIYVYQFSDELTVSTDSYTYTFVNDNGTVRETDIFSWLPDSYREYDEFICENEMISVYDNYIVFCDESNPSTGYSWINTEGKEHVKEEIDSACRFWTDDASTGSPVCSVRVYSPLKDGDFDFSWVYARSWEIEDTTEETASKRFVVSGSQITDSKEESKIFDGMTAEEFIEKAARGGELIKLGTYNKFEKTFGTLSVHGKYVVFCEYYSCMGKTSFDYTGTGTLREIQTCKTDEIAATGGSYHTMYIYKADTPGTINLNVYSEDFPGNTKDLLYTEILTVDENLNITVENAEKPETEEKANSGGTEGEVNSDVFGEQAADDKEESKNEAVIAGDINSDGKTDVTDLTELALALVGDQTLTETQQKAADVDRDGDVKLLDLAKFKQFLSKAIESLD